MKKTFSRLFGLYASFNSLSQGTLLFNNQVIEGLPRIYGPDGTTGLSASNGSYYVDLVVEGATNLIDLHTGLELRPSKFYLASRNAGLFPGAVVVAMGIPPGPMTTAKVTVRAWDATSGTDYCSASSAGAISFAQTGFGGLGNPPSSPAVFTGFQSFQISNGICLSCESVRPTLTPAGDGSFIVGWNTRISGPWQVLYSTNLMTWVEYTYPKNYPEFKAVIIHPQSPMGFFRLQYLYKKECY